MNYQHTWEWEKRKLPCKIREENEETDKQTDNLRNKLIEVIEKLATKNPLDFQRDGAYSINPQKRQPAQKDKRTKHLRNNGKMIFDNQSISPSSSNTFENGNSCHGVSSNFHRNNSTTSLKKISEGASCTSSSNNPYPIKKKFSLHRSFSTLSLSAQVEDDEKKSQHDGHKPKTKRKKKTHQIKTANQRELQKKSA